MTPTYQEATALLEKYPYFSFAAIKALEKAPDAEARTRLSRLIAVNVGDPADAAEILGLNFESLADFYPDSLPPRLDTINTIDTFLSTFGSEASAPSLPREANPSAKPSSGEAGLSQGDLTEEEAIRVKSEALASGSSQAPDSTASAIDAFLRAVPPPQPRRRKPQPIASAEETPALTESFARILIKKRNYEKALEIIQELNLKNPEKSVYFADQIRFLKKLIINQAAKNR